MTIFGVYVSYNAVMIALLLVLLLSFIAQGKVRRTFKRYNDLPGARGVSAGEAAREMLLDHGSNTAVQPINGDLTDHFDPRNNTVGLSTEVYPSTSVAALAIAAHEVGHVLQHQEGYTPLKIRSAVLPMANLGSMAGPYIIIIGLFINSYTVAMIGFWLYAAMFLFQLVTLPVEFNASARGLEMLDRGGFVARENRDEAGKVLRAAAMTYVLAALGSFLSLLRFFMLINGNRRRS